MKKILNLFLMLILLGSVITSCSSDEDRLFRAIKKGDLQEVESLVKSGVSVLTNNKNGLSPLDVARLNNQTEIAEFIYGEIKIILDKETQSLLKTVFREELRKLKETENERKKHYELYLDSNDRLMELMSDDIRLSERILQDQDKYFKAHQNHVKVFINSKVDLIEAILKELVKRDKLYKIESKEARHIVNVSIMYSLGKI